MWRTLGFEFTVNRDIHLRGSLQENPECEWSTGFLCPLLYAKSFHSVADPFNPGRSRKSFLSTPALLPVEASECTAGHFSPLFLSSTYWISRILEERVGGRTWKKGDVSEKHLWKQKEVWPNMFLGRRLALVNWGHLFCQTLWGTCCFMFVNRREAGSVVSFPNWQKQNCPFLGQV